MTFSNNSDHQQIINACQQWLKTVVIKYNFCPFARKEFEAQTIEYQICNEQQIDAVLNQIQTACQQLDDNPNISTTLMILSTGYDNFDKYLDLIDAAQATIIDPDYEGIYQLASFHPDYCFADAKNDDPANYTNRSPHPMIHLLREQQLEQAIETYPDPESIPDKNITLARRKGLEHMQKLLNDCQLK